MGLALLGCSGLCRIDYTQIGRRASWQRPDDVIRALEIRPGDRVADIGAGEGYFVPYLAQAVGSTGRVYAVEVDSEVAERLEKTVEKDAYPNVQVVRGEAQDALLPDGAIDLVLLVNTYHHIEDRESYFSRLRSDLTASGRVAIVEPNPELGGILGLFVEEGHATSAEDLREGMAGAGYAPSKSFDFLPVQVFEVFTPIGSAR
jgi:protein-L-isoaspartate O-methyltransferase